MTWDELLTIYITVLPIILASTFSTSLLKLPVLRRLRTPIDGGLNMSDGRRIFGDNKSWIGAAVLICLAIILTVFWGLVNSLNPAVQAHNWLYSVHSNTFTYNMVAGALLGLAYIVAELPNSFMKRRLRIAPGAVLSGMRGIPNIIIDHTDSVIGAAIVLWYLCRLTFVEFMVIIVVGGATHLIVNILLVRVGVKKNI